MQKRSTLFSISIGLLLFLSSICTATTMYVTSESAELKSESSSTSSTIVELERGTALALISQDGRWYQVATQDNQAGWIYRGKVSEEEPVLDDMGEDGEGLGGLLGGLSGSDIRADAADSSRSIRGLSPEAEEYANKTGSPQKNRDALNSVISRNVGDGEIDQFLREGKVGEYAD